MEKITVFGMPAKEATIVLSLDHGLRNLTKLTFLRLPSTLQKTTDDGFASDDGSGNVFPRRLQSVSFQDCPFLQSIERDAISRCTALVHIDLSGCSSFQIIGPAAFQYCTQLQTVILPSSLTTIESSAFSGNTVLKIVYWMGSGPAANIASNAFPSGVEHVYNYIPLTLKGKSQGIFSTPLRLLKSFRRMKKEEESIYEFRMNMFKFAIAAAATVIVVAGNLSKAKATRLTRVQQTCNQIRKNRETERLDNSLPVGSEHYYIVSKLNFCANALISTTYAYLTTSGTGSGLVSRNKEGTNVVLAQFPSSGDLTSFGLTPSDIKTIAIPNDIQDWPTSALNGCTNLEKLTTFGMPAKEATIVLSLDHGLRNLTKLTFLRFPSTFQSTADGFHGDVGSGHILPQSLQSVNLQDCSLLEHLGHSAFRYCSLTSIDLSNCSSLKYVGNSSFRLCPLTVINFSDCSALQFIGAHAFRECPQIKIAFLPASLTTLDNFTFYDTPLQKVYWEGDGNGVTIWNNCFPSSAEHIYNYKS